MAIQPGGRQVSETAFDALSGTERATNWVDLAPPDIEREDEVLSRWKVAMVLGGLLLVEGLLYFVSSTYQRGTGFVSSFGSWGTLLIGFSMLLVLAALFLGLVIGGDFTFTILGAAGIGFLSAGSSWAFPELGELIVAAVLLCGVLLLPLGAAYSISAWSRSDDD